MRPGRQPDHRHLQPASPKPAAYIPSQLGSYAGDGSQVMKAGGSQRVLTALKLPILSHTTASRPARPASRPTAC